MPASFKESLGPTILEFWILLDGVSSFPENTNVVPQITAEECHV